MCLLHALSSRWGPSARPRITQGLVSYQLEGASSDPEARLVTPHLAPSALTVGGGASMHSANVIFCLAAGPAACGSQCKERWYLCL